MYVSSLRVVSTIIDMLWHAWLEAYIAHIEYGVVLVLAYNDNVIHVAGGESGDFKSGAAATSFPQQTSAAHTGMFFFIRLLILGHTHLDGIGIYHLCSYIPILMVNKNYTQYS